ncbi:glycerate kinase family protein [Undibacterium crateris]|uniref:glycerate kinase family protein n=1 Tax=Undibacterium crateris TaxID=2528175 RepID=UPI00138A6891|nr:glycerate kinase [Undibacterium crateris]NDI87637.1 glycerate kinase [Undibacterium crateris]
MMVSETNQPLRVLIAPDSFKGSLQAHEVAQHISTGVKKAIPNSVITLAPIADGGEGTAKTVVQKLGGHWGTIKVTNANCDRIELRFGICSSATVPIFVIFDVAEIVGLPDAILPVEARTTKGVGEAVRTLAGLGYKTIVVALGGSSTNDGGIGMLAELIVRVKDEHGNVFTPTLGTLDEISSMCIREDSTWLSDVNLIALTDVNSRLTGPNGASRIFGTQKGLIDVEKTDFLVEKLASRISAMFSEDHSRVEGAGAAGGLGFAIRVLGGKLQPGAEFILNILGMDDSRMDFDWVITGEGHSDSQTLLGKGPISIARLAKKKNIPVTLLSGAITSSVQLFDEFDGCFSIQRSPVTLAFAIQNAGVLLESAAQNLAALFLCSTRSIKVSASPKPSGR